MGGVLYAIAVVLIVLWLIGFAFHILGATIHLLLVLAVVLALWNFVQGRRRKV